jgi:hypothetical protein
VSNPPQPTTLSPKFRAILGAVLFIAVAIFFLALHHNHDDSGPRDIKEIKDGWWLHQQMPTPTPTPRAVATPTLRPIVVQTPPRPVPHAQPSICQICMERMLRYYKAIETGMGADTASARELPQLIHADGHPNPQPSPNIFAFGGYQQ